MSGNLEMYPVSGQTINKINKQVYLDTQPLDVYIKQI